MRKKMYSKAQVYEWISQYRIKYGETKGAWRDIYCDKIIKYLEEQNDVSSFCLEVIIEDPKRAPEIKISKISTLRFC